MVASGQKQTNKQVHQVEIHERALPVQYTPWHSSSLQTCGSWSFHGKPKKQLDEAEICSETHGMYL